MKPPAPLPWLELSAATAEALAARHATPLYVYDLDVLRARARALRAAFPTKVLYGVKANPHPGLLRALRGEAGLGGVPPAEPGPARRGEVDGLDVASAGELTRAVEAGWPGAALSFAGPGKRREELALALAHDALVSVESVRELALLASLARAAGKQGRVRLRVNPAQAVHAFRVRMVGAPSPFGIDEEALPGAAAALLEAGDALALEGVHVHAGGQCTSPGGFAAAAALGLDLAQRLGRLLDTRVRSVNFGGGLGVLAPGAELDVVATGERLATMLAKFEAAAGYRPETFVEPGRWLAAPAGVYVARVVSEKVSRGVHFVVLDGGLHQHLGATGRLAPPDAPRLPVVNVSRPAAPVVKRTVVGPLCTPLDSLGEVELPEPRVGDLLAVLGSGAYGYSFSPLLFLGHPLPQEVLLEGDRPLEAEASSKDPARPALPDAPRG